MIGQNLKDNEEKKPNSREMEKLKRDFPQFFSKDGEFKLDMFKDFLGEEEVDISKEGYELKFLGKSYAKYLSSLETETYISPDSCHNEKDENKNSENLYIVGDNLDALKHMLGSYSGKIKCIYIDPPYNTGTDGFVYPDNFQFNKEDLSEKIGITEEEAGRILELAGKSTHSAWMTFMYPRLTLARDLLSDDGVIFISIDDNEQANLKLMCDEVFGEENCVGIISRKMKSGGNKGQYFSPNMEAILVYARYLNKLGYFREAISAEVAKSYNRVEEEGKRKGEKFTIKGLCQPGLGNRPNQRYWIKTPDGSFLIPKGKNFPAKLIEGSKVTPTDEDTSWKWTYDRFIKEKEEGNIFFQKNIRSDSLVDENGNTAKWNVYNKIWLNDRKKEGRVPVDLINKWENRISSVELKELGIPFDFAKPVNLIKYLISIVDENENMIILDYFSGSSTTADAVMQLNAEDGGNRKYIMVQLPESIDSNKEAYQKGYRSIDEIGRARIEKAAEKIKKETGADIDYGYKLYYLEKPSEKTLIDLENFVPEIKLITDDMVSIFDNEHSNGKESILSTWLMEDGYGLSKSTDKYKLNNYDADLIDKTLYIIDEGLTQDDSMVLIKRIENEELDITRIVIYVHSVPFNVLHELRKNLKVLRNNKNVTLIERF